LNSSSRRLSKFTAIWDIDSPFGPPEGWNFHSQTEQAHPWNPSFSIHTISRGIAGFYAARGNLGRDAGLAEHYFVPRILIEDDVLAGRRQDDFLNMFPSSEELSCVPCQRT
jgi:hypothetical protein